MAAWESIVSRLNSYLKRSGNENDRIKMSLWGDLVKLARTTQLWDICRVASCFAVLYDDGRWKNHFQLKTESLSRKGNRGTVVNQSQASNNSTSGPDQTNPESEKVESTNEDLKSHKKEETDLYNTSLLGKANRFDKMLIELIWDVYVIRAEAFIQAIRNEGAQLFTYPERPRDFKKHPKGYIRNTTKEDSDWKSYCECLRRMSDSVVNCFLKSASLAGELQAPWLLQNSAIYLWNYSIHVISLAEHSILVPSFQIMFDFMRQMVNERMVDIITQYGVILAHGLIQKMIPATPTILYNIFEIASSDNTVDKKIKKGKESPKLKPNLQNTAQGQTDALAQYKKAFDICQYLMDITADVVPISAVDNTQTQGSSSAPTSKPQPFEKRVGILTKYRLIEMWVQCKQMLQQSIGSTFGTEDTENKTGQRTLVRAITAVEMLWISQNEFYKFSEAPNVEECLQLIEIAEWSQPELALELLMKLCFVSMNGGGTNTVDLINKIAKTASKYGSMKGENKGALALSYITFCQGISLHKNSAQYFSILIECLSLLVQACCYAKEAKSYFLVSQITHYFWNVAQTIMQRSSGSLRITKELETMILCMTSTVDKKRLKLFFESQTEEELPRIEFELEDKLPHDVQCQDNQKLINIDQSKSLFQSCYRRLMSKSSLEQDLVVRIQMYVAVFQSHFSQEKWTEALAVLDSAISELPRTNHRLELFRHRVLIKVRLDQSIEMDIQKFKSQPEHELSMLWREVALWSKSPSSQLNSYQKSIEALKLPENDFLKAEIVKELSQWMFHYNYPIEICDQFIEWAIDILLNVVFKQEKLLDFNSATKSKLNSGSNKTGKLKTNIQVENVIINDTKNETEFLEAVQQPKEIVHGIYLQPCCPKTFDDLINIHQLSALFINLVFRAKILKISNASSEECIIMATACISRMWKVSMKNVASVIRDISKTRLESDSPSKSKDKKPKKDKGTPLEPEQNKSKVMKRKGPVDWIPSSSEDWVSFEVSDEVLEALNSSSYMPIFGLNSTSIKNMGEFMENCDSLVDLLEDLGYELLAFPILSMMDVLSRGSETVTAKILNQYVHLKWLKITLRLNMTTAYAHREKFIDTLNISPESLSYATLLENTIKEYIKDNNSEDKLIKFPLDFEGSSKTYMNIPHLSRKLTADGYIHETWIKLSDILIFLGYNKEATEVLEEARKITEILGDEKMLLQIYLLKAKLYLNLGEVEDAVRMLDELEDKFSLFSLKQWKIVVDLLLEISFNVSYSSKKIEIIRTRLIRLKEHTEKRLLKANLSNQQSEIESLMMNITFYVFLIDQHLMDLEIDENAITKTDIIRRLMSFVPRINQLITQYHTLTDIPGLTSAITTKIKLLDKIINYLDIEDGKIIILKKLKTIEDLENILMIKFDDIHKMCLESTNHTYSLAIDRKLAKAKLLLVDCLMEIYKIDVDKKVKLTLEHRQKDQLKQIIDEYVADSIPDKELFDWKEVVSGISDRILSTLNDIHSLSRIIPDINAKILSRYGHVMKLRALEIHPLNDEQWTFSMQDETIKEAIIETETSLVDPGNKEDADLELTPLEYRKRILENQMKTNLSQSQEYISQATELLTQSINLSINSQNYEEGAYAINLLIDILGQFEAPTSAHLLCLYQSCRASIQLRNRLSSTLRSASMGQLAALILQLSYMQKSSQLHDSNLTSSLLYRSILEKLNNNFLAWKVTNVTLNQSDLLKDLSKISNGFCIIQHSLDSSYVYSAFIDAKQKAVSTAKQGNKPLVVDKSTICRFKTSAEYTQSIIQAWNSFKIRMEKSVYNIENSRTVNQEKIQLYSHIDSQEDIQRSMDEKNQLERDINKKILELQNEFTKLTKELFEYLGPILEPLTHLLPSTTSRNNSSNQKNIAQPNTPKESLVLLIDEILMCTSIESIKYFKCPLSRDFSLQILHHRFKGLEKGEAEANDSVQNLEAGKKKDKSKIPHRIPALRDINKKSTKILPLNRQIPVGSLPLDTNQFRFIVDPHLDTKSINEQSLTLAFKKELTINSVREQQITPRWFGLVGEDDYPSLEEIELYLKDAPSVIYLNTENIVSLMTPQRIAMLNATELQLMCCFDRMNNRIFKSRMIGKSRSNNHLDLKNEDSGSAAQLLTLAGTKTLVSNQYTGLINWNIMEMTRLFNYFLDEGQSVCESVYSIRMVIESLNSSDTEGETHKEQDQRLELMLYNPVVYGLPNFVINGSSG